MTHNVEKLPKWAQTRIRQLTETIARLEKEIAIHTKEGATHETPNTFLVSDLGRNVPLGRDVTIRFMPGASELDVECSDRRGRDLIEVRNRANASVTGLAVFPVVTNVLTIRAQDPDQ